jgi:hypothetical protein
MRLRLKFQKSVSIIQEEISEEEEEYFDESEAPSIENYEKIEEEKSD